jgi:hypothetical protein
VVVDLSTLSTPSSSSFPPIRDVLSSARLFTAEYSGTRDKGRSERRHDLPTRDRLVYTLSLLFKNNLRKRIISQQSSSQSFHYALRTEE